MSRFRRLSAAATQAVAERLDRLGQTLELLGERLREAIAETVARAAADAARDAVLALMSDQPAYPSRVLWPQRDPYRDDRHPNNESRCYPDEYPDELVREEYDRYEPAALPTSTERRRRWGRALAVGFQVAAGLLSRRPGRFMMTTALGVGLVSALTVYVGGPLAVAAAALVGSAFGLAALSDLTRGPHVRAP
jgi:hypothetical protein